MESQEKGIKKINCLKEKGSILSDLWYSRNGLYFLIKFLEERILQGNGHRYHAVLFNSILSFCSSAVCFILYGFQETAVDSSSARKSAFLCVACRAADRIFTDHIRDYLVGSKGF